MRFNYMKERTSGVHKQDWPKRPKVPITLFNGSRYQNLYALIDSGADVCLFNAGIGRLLGIDLVTGQEFPVGGIGSAITARLHTVEVRVQGISDRVEIEVGFTESPNVSALLGGHGFFDNFRVSFERYRWQFEVTLRPAPTQP